MDHQDRESRQLTSDIASTVRCIQISQMLKYVLWGVVRGGLHFRTNEKRRLLAVHEHPRRWVLLSPLYREENGADPACHFLLFSHVFEGIRINICEYTFLQIGYEEQPTST